MAISHPGKLQACSPRQQYSTIPHQSQIPSSTSIEAPFLLYPRGQVWRVKKSGAKTQRMWTILYTCETRYSPLSVPDEIHYLERAQRKLRSYCAVNMYI
jgi:hypothetical protein